MMIANRLSTIKQADRVVFIQDGKVLDSGTFEELIERNSDFSTTVGLSD